MRQRRNFVAWAVVVFFFRAVANAAPASQPASRPALSTAHWIEMRSENFALRTDLDAAVAQRMLANLESQARAAGDFAFLHAALPRMTITVIAFRDAAEAAAVCGNIVEKSIAWNDSAFSLCVVGDAPVKRDSS